MSTYKEKLTDALQIMERQYNVDPRQSVDFIEDMEHLLKGDLTPEKVFLFVGNGCFKEVYLTPMENWVVKFISENNLTYNEEVILNAAQGTNMERLFAPTFIIPLPKAVKPAGPEVTGDDYSPSEEEVFTHIALQPWVEIIMNISEYDLKHVRDTIHNSSQYPEPRLMTEEMEAIQSLCTPDVGAHYWVEDIYFMYGHEILQELRQFMDDYSICDLHNQNIGYLNGRPIILDWLSIPKKREVNYYIG